LEVKISEIVIEKIAMIIDRYYPMDRYTVTIESLDNIKFKSADELKDVTPTILELMGVPLTC
jgi:bisphosphoglycerate-independent phosphoglycerate mutase (AlkP superfamily)